MQLSAHIQELATIAACGVFVVVALCVAAAAGFGRSAQRVFVRARRDRP